MWKLTISVLDWSQAPLAARCVLVVIADEASWPAGEIVGRERHFAEDRLDISVRQFRRHVATLEKLGELVCERRPGGMTRYIIPQLPGEPDREKADQERMKRRAEYRRKRPAPALVAPPEPAPPEPAPAAPGIAPAAADWSPLSPSTARMWQRACALLRDRVRDAQYENWIAPIRVASVRRADHTVTVTLRTDTAYHAQHLRDRYADTLRVALADALAVTLSQLTLEIQETSEAAQ